MSHPPQNLKSRLLHGLQDELNLWQKAFASPALYLLALVSLLALGLAWQIGLNYTIDTNSHLRLDEPFVQNFYAREPGIPKDGVPTYRWSKGESYLQFSGIGKRAYGLRLQLQGAANPAPQITVYANETLIGFYKLEPGLKNYDFEIPATAITGASGDLRLILKASTFQPEGDSRELGIVFSGAELQARNGGFSLPPVRQLGYLLAVVLLTYLIIARAGASGWISAGVGGLILALLVYVVATPARPWLTIFTTELAFAFFLSLVALVIVDIPMRLVWEKRWERAWVLGIFGLALAIRFAGTLHPYIQMVDIGFHRNRQILLSDRGEFFQKIASNEWGGKLTYYPMTQYFIMGQFRWLIPDITLLHKFWMVLFESSRALLMFYLLKRAVGDGRAGVLAAFLMVTLPVALISIGFGQVSNLYGEWLLLVGLCLIVVKYDRLRQWPYFVMLVAVLLAAFMQHPGIIILSGMVFLLITVILAIKARPGGKILIAAYVVALLLSIAIYNRVTLAEMVPQAFDTLNSKLSGKPAEGSKPTLLQVGGSVDDGRLGLHQTRVNNFGDWLWGGLKGFWAEARVYFNLLPLLMLPWSLWWLWRTGKVGHEPVEPDDNEEKRQGRMRLFWVSLAWLLTTAIFAVLGWVLNLYVRYSLFALPIVAMGGSIFLSRLWKRSWAGKALTLAICLFFLITILALWYDRIIFRSTELRD